MNQKIDIEKSRKEIKEVIKGKSLNDAMNIVEEIFKSKNVEIRFKKMKIQKYEVFEIGIKTTLYGFRCKKESFLIWNWWNVQIVKDSL